ncbi:hypothetical protein [Streptomyces globisporus]|uniref:hypothetical protein n=1 Tax=Streptomyces globisporus TaxID=1908 RepID=UPI0004C706C1|nr:hypothetical protein [Streptomyces globisporus]
MTTPRTFDGIVEPEKAAGTRLGRSDRHTAGRQRIGTFADATGAPQGASPARRARGRIHVDQDGAAEGPFGTTTERDGGGRPVRVADTVTVAVP